MHNNSFWAPSFLSIYWGGDTCATACMKRSEANFQVSPQVTLELHHCSHSSDGATATTAATTTAAAERGALTALAH